MPGAKRCASAQLISRYRAFAIKVISATWKSVALAAIKVKAAYSPAEALFNRLAKKALQRRQTCVSCSDAEGKGNGKIAQCDGNTVTHAV